MDEQIAVCLPRRGDVPVRLAVFGDERLARLVGGGNDRAFAALYDRYHQPLYRYCRSMVRHDADAQDVLQSAFTRALVALRDGRRDAPVKPWLFRIAHNESVSLLRRRRPQCELPQTLESPVPSLEETTDQRARLGLLVEDLQALPERQRGALVMRELSGLSHEQVGLALGISVGAAKQTVFEARRSLAEFSEGRLMACSEVQRVISDGDKRALRGRRVRAHLRACSDCAAFAAAIPARRADLLALSPALPAAAATGLFARVAGSGSGHGGGGGLAAGVTGKTVGAVVSTKGAIAGVAIVATAAVGAAGVARHLTPPSFNAHGSAGARARHGGSPLRAPGASSPVMSSTAAAYSGRRGRPATIAHHDLARSSASAAVRSGATNASAAHGNGAPSFATPGSSTTDARARSGSATAHPGARHHLGASGQPGATAHRGRPPSAGSPGTSHRTSTTGHRATGHAGGRRPGNPGGAPQPAPTGRPTATPSGSQSPGTTVKGNTSTAAPLGGSGTNAATPPGRAGSSAQAGGASMPPGVPTTSTGVSQP